MSKAGQAIRSRHSVNPILLDGIDRCAEKTVAGMPAALVEAARRKLLDNRSTRDAEWDKEHDDGSLRETMEKIAGVSFERMGPQHTEFELPPVRK